MVNDYSCLNSEGYSLWGNQYISKVFAHTLFWCSVASVGEDARPVQYSGPSSGAFQGPHLQNPWESLPMK